MTTNDLHDPWDLPDEMWPEFQATALTRAGVLVSGLVLLAYLIQLTVSFLAGRESSPAAAVGDVVSLGLSALLLWRVWARQAVWAALLAGVFFAAEFAAQVMSFLSGQPTGGLVIMFATLAGACGLSVYGALRLARLREEYQA